MVLPQSLRPSKRGMQVITASLAILMSVAVTGIAVAAPIDDLKVSSYSYGGYQCYWGGRSYLVSGGGSQGYSGTVITSPECTNGYREFYTTGLTTTNFHLYYYSDWVLYNHVWTFYNRSDLCQLGASHRISKSGIDSSPYLYTFVAGCWPA